MVIRARPRSTRAATALERVHLGADDDELSIEVNGATDLRDRELLRPRRRDEMFALFAAHDHDDGLRAER